MNKGVVAATLAALLFASCSSATKPPVFVSDDAYHAYLEGCNLVNVVAGHTNATYLLDFPEPIRVRQVRGSITVEGGGLWYEGIYPILQIQRYGKSGKIYEVHGDRTGRFVLKHHLTEGIYCFVASASWVGFHGYYGIIIIDKKADKTKEIKIELPAAVP